MRGDVLRVQAPDVGLVVCGFLRRVTSPANDIDSKRPEAAANWRHGRAPRPAQVWRASGHAHIRYRRGSNSSRINAATGSWALLRRSLPRPRRGGESVVPVRRGGLCAPLPGLVRCALSWLADRHGTSSALAATGSTCARMGPGTGGALAGAAGAQGGVACTCWKARGGLRSRCGRWRARRVSASFHSFVSGKRTQMQRHALRRMPPAALTNLLGETGCPL